ncbi:MAG: FadR/GntR family transcriptional regulator [Azospirillaceae bacterium]
MADRRGDVTGAQLGPTPVPGGPASADPHGADGRTYSRRRLHGRVVYELGGRILKGAWPPGATLPTEAELGGELGVSRSALREAIKTLAAKGLVETRPKIGTRVRPRELWHMLDPDVLAWRAAAPDVHHLATELLCVRRIVEPEAAAIAAARATEEDIAAIEAAWQAMVAAGNDPEATVGPDVRLHLAILQATHNDFLVSLGALTETAMAASIELSSTHPGAPETALPAHAAVVDAIRSRSPDAARAAMAALLDKTAETIAGATDPAAPRSGDP